MASPVLLEFANLLHSLQTLKPPGVNKSKVEAITNICTSKDNLNIDRQTLVEAIVTSFKRSPPTHKLGVLYIVDSVTRQWIAAGGPYAIGVQKMTEALPSLMNELMDTAPESQKDRISKLIDIWISSKSFPQDMLAIFKQRLNAPSQTPANGIAPPQGIVPVNGHASHIQPTAVQPTAPVPANAGTNTFYGSQGSVHQSPFTVPPAPPAPAPSVSMQNSIPSGQPGVMPYSQPVNGAAQPAQTQQYSSNIQAPAPASEQNLLAAFQNAQGSVNNNLPNQLMLLQQLAQQFTPEQLQGVIAALGIQLPVPPSSIPVPQGAPQPVAQSPQNGQYQMQNGHGRDDQDYQTRYRERSRSPDAKRRRVTPPNRRDSPTYGVYDPSAAQSDSSRQDFDRRDRGRGRGNRNEYRRRTPPRERPISPAMVPRPMQQKLNGQQKPIGYDHKIPAGRIRVLSRTLFIGGVNERTNEGELMNYMARYAQVQSCIVNHDKRHAFLKLISHQDAITAKQSVEQLPETEYRHLFERINWAVGFGPTQFADYKLGESTLPIDVLTEADRKWLRTAEFGGTGGQEIMQGMIVEEPDIEIGAGPSSKAISRRGGRGQGFGGRGGNDNFQPRRERERRYEDNPPRYQRQDRPQPPPMETQMMPEPVTVGPPPPVPTFGAPIPGFPSYNSFR